MQHAASRPKVEQSIGRDTVRAVVPHAQCAHANVSGTDEHPADASASTSDTSARARRVASMRSRYQASPHRNVRVA
jgi:hypothetical protein